MPCVSRLVPQPRTPGFPPREKSNTSFGGDAGVPAKGKEQHLLRRGRRGSRQGKRATPPTAFRFRGIVIFLSLPLIFLLSGGCAFPSPYPSPSEIDQASRAGERPDPRRSTSNERDRARYGATEKQCDETSRCIDQCERIFSRRAERDECEAFSVSEVKEFERISLFLSGKDENGRTVSEDAVYYGNINRIQEEVLEDFVRIFENLSGWLSSKIPSGTRKETFRNWVAERPGIAEVFQDQDEDFNVFEAMFGSCGSGLASTRGYTETSTLSGRRGGTGKPITLAVGKGNRELIQWACDNAEEKSCASSSESAKACRL